MALGTGRWEGGVETPFRRRVESAHRLAGTARRSQARPRRSLKRHGGGRGGRELVKQADDQTPDAEDSQKDDHAAEGCVRGRNSGVRFRYSTKRSERRRGTAAPLEKPGRKAGCAGLLRGGLGIASAPGRRFPILEV